MKVVLTQDVLKLGKAGDIKMVRDGYGRNYLIPQGLAVLATPGAMRQAEDIRQRAQRHRDRMSTEYTSLAARINGVTLTFQAKAGETGKLYGSITPAMLATRLSDKLGVEIDRRKMDTAPLRELGTHKVAVYLAADITGTFIVNILREGEVERPAAQAAALAPVTASADTPAEADEEAAPTPEPEPEPEAEQGEPAEAD